MGGKNSRSEAKIQLKTRKRAPNMGLIWSQDGPGSQGGKE